VCDCFDWSLSLVFVTNRVRFDPVLSTPSGDFTPHILKSFSIDTFYTPIYSLFLQVIYLLICMYVYIYICMYICIYFMVQQPTTDQGILSIEATRSHSDTPQLVGLLWTSDQIDAETSTWQHTTPKREGHPCPDWNSNPQSQQVSGLRPTPHATRLLNYLLRLK